MDELKTLVVCLSTDLPSEADRDPNYIYFVYNMLCLYMGKALYGEDFCIVDSMPNEPSVDNLYICLDDGKVKVYDDYSINIIGEVQTREMLNILKEAGTMYYFNSKIRYIDMQNRMLVLPFNNGRYSLTVDIPWDLEYNDHTIIKYNTESERFEIYGETLDEDPLDTKGFRGHETNTVKVEVTDGRIKANVKVSEAFDNMLKVADDGLYVAVRNAVTHQEFDAWKNSYRNYKIELDFYMNSIREAFEKIEELISEEVIDQKIQSQLQELYPTIDEAITNFEIINNNVNEALAKYSTYAQTEFERIDEELSTAIDETNTWHPLILDREFAIISLALSLYINGEEGV